jgi:DNA-binding NtrC family response regulator
LARILVIAADALIRETLKAMLQLDGHEVALAPHGEEAAQRFRKQAAELAICDICIRRGGGTETVSAIRRLSPDIPVIAMMGAAGSVPDSCDEDYAFHMNTVRLIDSTATIAKPSNPRDLFALIRRCLGGTTSGA